MNLRKKKEKLQVSRCRTNVDELTGHTPFTLNRFNLSIKHD